MAWKSYSKIILNSNKGRADILGCKINYFVLQFPIANYTHYCNPEQEESLNTWLLYKFLVRGNPLSTNADIPAFWTHSPCTHFGQIYSTKFTQSCLLCTHLGHLPLSLGAYILPTPTGLIHAFERFPDPLRHFTSLSLARQHLLPGREVLRADILPGQRPPHEPPAPAVALRDVGHPPRREAVLGRGARRPVQEVERGAQLPREGVRQRPPRGPHVALGHAGPEPGADLGAGRDALGRVAPPLLVPHAARQAHGELLEVVGVAELADEAREEVEVAAEGRRRRRNQGGEPEVADDVVGRQRGEEELLVEGLVLGDDGGHQDGQEANEEGHDLAAACCRHPSSLLLSSFTSIRLFS